MCASSRRGFTLPELILATALLLLALGVSAMFVLTLLHAFSRGSTRAELQQQATTVLARVTTDLQSSTTHAVTLLNPLGTDPSKAVALALIPIEGTTAPEGIVTWQQAVVVYAWDRGTGSLVRRVFTPGDALGDAARLDPLAPRKVSDALLTSMASTRAQGEQRLASDVADFAIHHLNEGGTYIQPPLTVSIRTEKHGSHDHRANEVFELFRTVALRNHGSQP